MNADECKNFVELEKGIKIKLIITRPCPAEALKVIVAQNAKVRDLKREIKKCFSGSQCNKISWKYVWKTYCLRFDRTLLDEDDFRISELGLKNKSEIQFVKKKRTNK